MEHTRVQDVDNVFRHPSRVELALYAHAELQELVKGPKQRPTDGPVKVVRGRMSVGKSGHSI
jgi:hypothetical protein